MPQINPSDRKSRKPMAGKLPGKKTNANDQPTGRNLFLDNKGRLIYYNPVTKKAVYVPKFDYAKFNRLKIRYLISVAAFMLLYSVLTTWFEVPLWVPIVISIGILVYLEYSWYKFLNSLQPVKKFEKDKYASTVDLSLTSDAKTKVLIKIVLYAALGILLVVNAYEQAYSMFLILVCWAIMAACLFQAGLLAVQLAKAIKAESANPADSAKPAVTSTRSKR